MNHLNQQIINHSKKNAQNHKVKSLNTKYKAVWLFILILLIFTFNTQMRSTFNGNLIDLMSQSKHYESHRKKIEGIMNKKINPVDPKRISTLNTLQNFRVKAVNYTSKEKQSSVMKDNDLIFKKLLKVNTRKNQTFNTLNTSRSYSHKNLTNMKRTINEISQENNMFAQKLVTVKSHLSQEKLMSNYQRHLQIKQRLMKYENDEEYGVIPKKLKSLQKLKSLKFGESQRGYYHNSSRVSGSTNMRYQNEEEN